MRNLLLASTLATGLGFAATGAQADTIIDPLHGFCAAGCGEVSMGGNNVTTILGSPGFNGSNFGFWMSTGPQTQDFRIVFAEPDNSAQSPVTVTGTINGASVSGTATSLNIHWTANDLDTALGSNLPGGAQPNNPISNFLPFTKSVDAGANGYDLYLIDFGSRTLQGQDITTGMNLTETGAGVGSMIFGFIEIPQGNGAWTATASSGVLFDDGPNGSCTNCVPAPEPSSFGILGAGVALLGLGLIRKRA